LAGGDIFAAEEIDGFNAGDFLDAERADGGDYVGEMRAICEEQGKITLDGGEARYGFVLARISCGADGGVERRKPQLGEDDFLAEL